VIELRARQIRGTAMADEEMRREQHARERRGEIHPDRLERSGQDGRPERASRVHAHSRKRRFDRDVQKHERAGAEPREAMQTRVTRDMQNRQHHAG
jgi:hypothetical protein